MIHNPSLSTNNIEFKYISGKNWSVDPTELPATIYSAVLASDDGQFKWQYPRYGAVKSLSQGYDMYVEDDNVNRWSYIYPDTSSNFLYFSRYSPSEPFTHNQVLTFSEPNGGRGVNLQTYSYNDTRGAVSEASYIGGGTDNVTLGQYSVVGGGNANIATGYCSTIVGGGENRAYGDYSSIGGGYSNRAEGYGSTIYGGMLNTVTTDYATACGLVNNDLGRVFTIGNGRAWGGNQLLRSNAFSVSHEGILYALAFQSLNADYAEMYESQLEHKIPVGTTVTLEDGYIRPCRAGEVPFGVISDTAGVVLNSSHSEWHGKYVMEDKTVDDTVRVTRPVEKIAEQDVYRDGKWHREKLVYIDHEQVYDEVDLYDMEDNWIRKKKIPRVEKIGTKIVKQRCLNPLYDSSRQYIPRIHRPEWNVVGLLGKCKVLKGQVVHPRWLIFEEHGEYDIYLVR